MDTNVNYDYVTTTNNSGETVYKMNYLEPTSEPEKSMVKFFYDFQVNNLTDYTNSLSVGKWCLNNQLAYLREEDKPHENEQYEYTLINDADKYFNYSKFYYDSHIRLRRENKEGVLPTLKCNGTVLDSFKTVSNASNAADMYVSTLTADEIMYAGGAMNIEELGVTTATYYLVDGVVEDD